MPNTLLTLLHPERYHEHYRAGFWRDDTLYALVKAHAARAPDRVAMRSSYGEATYRRLVLHADAFASDLARKGVVPGQRVAVWLPGRVETAIALLACSRNGYICSPSLHRDYTVGDAINLLNRMRAVAVIAEEGYGADAARGDLFTRLAEVKTVQHFYKIKKNKMEVDGGIVDARVTGPLVPAEPVDANRVLYLAFTSGTTGTPKGVMHSDNTLLANARALSSDWNINSESIVYSLGPLSHNLGFGAMVMALAVGGELVIHDLPRGKSLVDRLIDTQTTFLIGVPTHAVDLLAELKSRKLSNLGKVRGFRISGASAPPELVADLLKFGITPQSGYGMTETCSHQYTVPDDDPRLIVESCGKSCSGYEIRIFDRDDRNRQVAPREIGEIGGRGASLMLGYFDDQATTEDSFNRDGWFMTGDLGWVDENGYLRITGRKKDIIIRGGHNIYPAKIEGLAAAHPAIQRVAAVGVPDDRLGERVCLVVMFWPHKKASVKDILGHLDDSGLSKYDMPEFFLQVDELPLTASGKIRKLDIVEAIAKGHAKPTAVRRAPETV